MRFNLQLTVKPLCVFLFAFIMQVSLAQVPQKFSFQAVVRSSSNQLITNQQVGVKVSILQGSASGNSVFSERHTPTTNANGLATFEIGNGTNISGSFATINWAGGSYFVKVETDPAGGTNYSITGTSQLLSVPYSLYSVITGGSSNGWGLTGNTGTNATANFIGTTDNNDLVLKRNAVKAGIIGSETTSFGNNTFTANNTGIWNSAFGAASLSKNTSGSYNTGLGFTSLQNNTTGTSNTSIGVQALLTNTTGDNNTAVGVNALILNQSGGKNVSVGAQALYNNTTGDENVAVGFEALAANTTKSGLVAVGFRALYLNSSGTFNTASGFGALQANTTGYDNTAHGSFALYNNIGGYANTAIGRYTLPIIQEGQFNVAVGYNVMPAITFGYSNTAVGQSSLRVMNSGSDNAAFGAKSLAALTSGTGNTAIGYDALYSLTSGSNNIALGQIATVPSATGSNQVRIGNTSITYAGVQVGWTVTSDRNWKSNIQPTILGLDFINKLNPVSYIRKNDESKKTEYGLIAQEVEAALNAAGATNTGIISKGDDGMYGVRYNDLLSPMIKAIQEQQVLIEQQKIAIEKLNQKVADLEGR